MCFVEENMFEGVEGALSGKRLASSGTDPKELLQAGL